MDFPSLTNYYYIKDHLGSTRMVVNESGEAIEANMYDSYGKLSQLVYSGTSSRLREKFTGKEFDDDGAVAGETNGLGLYYFGKRYYDPEIGTFTTKDPQDQSWNSYSYCYGDPLNLVDPDGEEAYFKVPVGYNLYKPAEVFLDLPVIGTNKNIASPLATTLGGGFAASLFVFEAIAMAGQNLKNAAPSSNNQYSSDEVYTGPGGETDVTGVNKYPVISEQIEMDPFNVMTDVLDEGSLQREMSFLELNEELSDPMNYIGGIGKGGKLLSKAASLGAKAVKLGLNASSPTSKIIVENLGMKTSDFIAKYRKASINSVFPSEYKSMTVEEALQKGGSSVRKLLTDARFAK